MNKCKKSISSFHYMEVLLSVADLTLILGKVMNLLKLFGHSS